MDKQENTNVQKDLGAFYTPIPLVEQLTQKALSLALISQVNTKFNQNFATIDEITANSNLSMLKAASEIIDKLTILDGSVGDGRFLIASSEYLSNIHKEIIKK